MRCLTLAHAFARVGWRCTFATVASSIATVPRLKGADHSIVVVGGDPAADAMDLLRRLGSKADLLIIDHPTWSASEESQFRPMATATMTIDGLKRRHATDIWLDPNPDHPIEELRLMAPPGCEILHGLEFIPVDPTIVSVRQVSLSGRRERGFRLDRMLVNFGAGDQLAALDLALRGIAESVRKPQVTVVAGDQAEKCRELAKRLALPCEILAWSDDLGGLMQRADLMIGAAGISAWERCCLGLPSLLVTVAENQLGTARFLGDRGAALSLGPVGGLTPRRVADSLTELAANPGALERMSGIAAGLVDGDGADRVAAAASRHCRQARPEPTA